MIETKSTTSSVQRLSNWLLLVAALVFAIVVVGGITRLTESGLSITEWKPVSGVLPPLTDAAWAEAFGKYQHIPEYREINGPAGMTLAQFKTIFFWEWVHRLLGRVIGLALLLPLIWFANKRQIPLGYGWRLFGLAVLVGVQGGIGWWMVASGLSERTDVSHYRLAAHLLTALFLLACLVWTALDLRARAGNPQAKPARLTRFGVTAAMVLLIQLLFGAYTAGLNAGQVANSWPMMNGQIFPDGVEWGRGFWSTFSSDPYLVHFIHRWWAWVVVAVLVVMGRKLKAIGARGASIAIHSAFGIQILLGILTVLSGVNIVLAVAHQAVGALLVASVAWGAHILGKREEAPV
jgi:heme a synthase